MKFLFVRPQKFRTTPYSSGVAEQRCRMGAPQQPLFVEFPEVERFPADA